MKATSLSLTLLAGVCLAQEPAPGTRLGVQDAVALARQANPGVLAARAELEAARQQRRWAFARQLPQVSANGFAVSTKPGATLAGTGMGTPLMAFPSGETWVANVMLMVPLWTGGQLQAVSSQAEGEERAALAELAEMDAEASLMATEAYWMAQLAADRVRQQAARAEAAREMHRTLQARFEAGKEILASVQRAQAEVAMAERELAMARAEQGKALLDLKATMGMDLAQEVALSDPLMLHPETPTLEAAVASALKWRGSVLKARALLDVERAKVRAADGLVHPQLYGVAMADTSNDEMMRGGTIGLTLSIPLFDAGERRAEAAKMRAMRSAAEQRVRQAEILAERDVRRAWLDLETALANQRSAEASLMAAEAGYEVVRLRVEAGKSILLEQLDALAVLVQARADLAQALFDHAVARARLQRSAGLTSQTPGAR